MAVWWTKSRSAVNAGFHSVMWTAGQAEPCAPRSDRTNGTRIRRKSLLSSGLQLLPRGRVKSHVDMCRTLLGYETSEFRFVKTVLINVILVCDHPEIQRKAMQHNGFRLS